MNNLERISSDGPSTFSLSQLTEHIVELERRGFFGVVELHFQNGRLGVIKQTESFKPSNRNFRGTHNGNVKR